MINFNSGMVRDGYTRPDDIDIEEVVEAPEVIDDNPAASFREDDK